MSYELQSGPVIIPLSAYNVGFGGGVSEEEVSTLITNTLNPIIDSIDELTSLNISTLALKTDVTSTSSTLNTKITSVSSEVSSNYALKTSIPNISNLATKTEVQTVSANANNKLSAYAKTTDLNNYATNSSVENVDNKLSSYITISQLEEQVSALMVLINELSGKLQ